MALSALVAANVEEFPIFEDGTALHVIDIVMPLISKIENYPGHVGFEAYKYRATIRELTQGE